MSIKISACNVTQNMHYGILVQDFWKGSVIIKNSSIMQNCNFGVYLHQKERPEVEKTEVFEASINKITRKGTLNGI